MVERIQKIVGFAPIYEPPPTLKGYLVHCHECGTVICERAVAITALCPDCVLDLLLNEEGGTQ